MARRRLDSLTGLRFLAALVVFGLHLEAMFPKSPYQPLTRIVEQGGAGVSFFFILSGFVLTWSHVAGDRPSGFWRRRAARLVPLHVLTWAGIGVLFVAVGRRPSGGPALVSLAGLAPWVPAHRFTEAMNVPSWSLGCEAFFYLLFPFMLPVVIRMSTQVRRLGLTALAAGIVTWAAICTPATFGTTRYWAVYLFPPARLAEFVIGMILAREVAEGTWPRLRLSLSAPVAVAAYLVAGWVPFAFEVSVTLVPFSLLIAAAAQADVSGQRTRMGSPAMVRLGIWSFAFYLVHVPILAALAYVEPARLSAPAAAANGAFALLICLGAAWVLHHAVERPLERILRAPRKAAAPILPAVVPGPGVMVRPS